MNAAKKSSFGSTIAFTVVLVSIYAGVRLYGESKGPAQVKFVENSTAANPVNGEKKLPGKPPELFGGEVYGTTVRLRESGAVGMAVSFGVFASASARGAFPTELGEVWAFVEREKLLPPGVELKSGELRSETSRFHVRYRREPFGIEVVGEPLAGNEAEPSVIVRLPLPTADGRTLTYYQSSTSAARTIPAAFESPNHLVAAGWSSRQWRGELLPNAPEIVSQLEAERKALAERGR